jgi:hypothetical protein
VAALLCNAKAMVRVIGVQPSGLLGSAVPICGGVVVGGRDGCAEEVAGVLGGGFDYGCDRGELLVSALAGEGYR